MCLSNVSGRTVAFTDTMKHDVLIIFFNHQKNHFFEFKNRIIEILNDFEINECFDSKIITNDRDKDILISEDNFEFLITCKYRESKNIRFDDVERTAANSRFLNV